jgi:hypothetical protein
MFFAYRVDEKEKNSERLLYRGVQSRGRVLLYFVRFLLVSWTITGFFAGRRLWWHLRNFGAL